MAETNAPEEHGRVAWGDAWRARASRAEPQVAVYPQQPAPAGRRRPYTGGFCILEQLLPLLRSGRIGRPVTWGSAMCHPRLHAGAPPGRKKMGKVSTEAKPCALLPFDLLSRYCLAYITTPSAPRSRFLSRLNTLPALSPGNASHTPSRMHRHDSGPVWLATPSL